jgi:hypothetical protein
VLRFVLMPLSIRQEDSEPEGAPATFEEEEAVLDAERAQQWDIAVHMCMEACTPSAQRDWLQDQHDQERREEYQRLANLRAPSDSCELQLERGQDGRAANNGVVWEDYSTNEYVE